MECFEGFLAHIVEGNRRPQLEFLASPAQNAVDENEQQDMSKNELCSSNETGIDDWDGETRTRVNSDVSTATVSFHKIKHLGGDLKMPIDMKTSKSPNAQLREMAADQCSSLNKKLKEKCTKLEEEILIMPSNPDQTLMQQLEKEEKSDLLTCSSNELKAEEELRAVTPDNRKSTTNDEESTLVKKLKHAREKADATVEEDGIDLKINTFKLVGKDTVEDALAKKFEKQLKKIDDNVKVDEVTTNHSAESLVEDALNDMLKRQQQKITDNVRVEEIKSKHLSKTLVGDALGEKLKKQQDKLSGNVKVEEIKSKHEPTTWVEDTLSEKLKKQQEKIYNNVKIEDVKSKHESKSLVGDALSEKLKKRQEKLSGNVKVEEVKSKHEPTTWVEDTLSEKLRKQQEKIKNNVKIQDVQSKYASKTWMEDSLGAKLKKQQEKINDNVNVVEVKSKHAPKSLVEDALGEKLKKQQRKNDGLYKIVKDVTSQHTAESTIEGGLAEILRKRRMKLEESSNAVGTLDQQQVIKEPAPSSCPKSTISHFKEPELLAKVQDEDNKITEVEKMNDINAPEIDEKLIEKEREVPEIPWWSHPESPSVVRVATGMKSKDSDHSNETLGKKMDMSLGCDMKLSTTSPFGMETSSTTALEQKKDTRGFASRKLKNLQDTLH